MLCGFLIIASRRHGLKQKTHRHAAVGLINFVNAQNPAAALVNSSAFVSSRFRLRFMYELYVGQ